MDTAAVQGPRLSRLCHTCRNVFDHGQEIRKKLNSLTGYLDLPYHAQVSSLIQSAKEGCVLCMRLFENVQSSTEFIAGKLPQVRQGTIRIIADWNPSQNVDTYEGKNILVSVFLQSSTDISTTQSFTVILQIKNSTEGKKSQHCLIKKQRSVLISPDRSIAPTPPSINILGSYSEICKRLA